MTDSALIRAAKFQGYLLTLTWGGGTLRLTDRPYPVTVLGREYASKPSIAIEIPANIGTLKEDEWRILLPLSSLTLGMTRGYRHAPVRVEVCELVEAESDTSKRVVFAGDVSKAVRNPRGKRGQVRLHCVTAKSMLDIPVGMQVNPECLSAFGDAYCGISLALLRRQVVVQSIENALVTLEGLDPTTERYWHRGWVEFEGLELGIRDQQAGNQVLLYEQPPANWLGATVTAFPGCNKSAEDCENKWNNIARFRGYGIAIPAYNPTYEEGGS